MSVPAFCLLSSTPQHPKTPSLPIPTPPARTTLGFSPRRRSYASDAADHSYPASPNHPAQLLAPAAHLPAEHKEGVLAAVPPQEHVYRPPAGSRQNSLNRAQPPHAPQPPEAVLNGPRPHLVKDFG